MRLTLLQKEILAWMILFVCCAAFGVYYINHVPNQHPGMIRLHVVANSDSPQDQVLKLKVRDRILEVMDGQEDLDSARAYLQENLDRIEEIAEEEIVGSGFEYPACARLKVTYIPEKSYEDLTLPAGNYEALKVVLGRGEGQNWWCVIFPQLCLLGEENGSDRIILKSKIKEMMKKQQKKEKVYYGRAAEGVLK